MIVETERKGKPKQWQAYKDITSIAAVSNAYAASMVTVLMMKLLTVKIAAAFGLCSE